MKAFLALLLCIHCVSSRADAADPSATVVQRQTWFVILTEGIAPCFTRLDADKNGKLDLAEYRKISRMGGHAEQHFNGADADKDGFLSIAEFTAHAESKLAAVEKPKQTNR